MILEAFSRHLQQPQYREVPPERVLFDWLSHMLATPPRQDDKVSCIIHAEIAQLSYNGHRFFEGRSNTGRQLLESLTAYCRSFDHWQFSRWLHQLRASDFSSNAGS